MTDYKTKPVGGEDTPLSVLDYGLGDANVIIEGGRLVWSRLDTGYMQNSTYALAAATVANVRCWGVCQEHFDNSAPVGGAPVNAFNNPGTAGVPMRFARGVFLLTGDGSVLQAQIGLPVYLLHDGESGQTGTAPTITANSGGGAYPFVGYVTTNPRGSTANPDPSKIPISIGLLSAKISGATQQDYVNDPTTHTGAFTAAIGTVHKINPSGATFAYQFPAITQAIDGMHLAVVNISTGSTATVAAPAGSDNVGNSAGTATGATAAGPTGGAVKTYVADNTLKAWLVGI